MLFLLRSRSGSGGRVLLSSASSGTDSVTGRCATTAVTPHFGLRYWKPTTAWTSKACLSWQEMLLLIHRVVWVQTTTACTSCNKKAPREQQTHRRRNNRLPQQVCTKAVAAEAAELLSLTHFQPAISSSYSIEEGKFPKFFPFLSPHRVFKNVLRSDGWEMTFKLGGKCGLQPLFSWRQMLKTT